VGTLMCVDNVNAVQPSLSPHLTSLPLSPRHSQTVRETLKWKSVGFAYVHTCDLRKGKPQEKPSSRSNKKNWAQKG
jgi:hypothetical protein